MHGANSGASLCATSVGKRSGIVVPSLGLASNRECPPFRAPAVSPWTGPPGPQVVRRGRPLPSLDVVVAFMGEARAPDEAPPDLRSRPTQIPNRPGCGRRRSHVGPRFAEVDQIRPNSAQVWCRLAPYGGPTLAEFGRVRRTQSRSKFGQLQPKFAEFGPSLAKLCTIIRTRRRGARLSAPGALVRSGVDQFAAHSAPSTRPKLGPSRPKSGRGRPKVGQHRPRCCGDLCPNSAELCHACVCVCPRSTTHICHRSRVDIGSCWPCGPNSGDFGPKRGPMLLHFPQARSRRNNRDGIHANTPCCMLWQQPRFGVIHKGWPPDFRKEVHANYRNASRC